MNLICQTVYVHNSHSIEKGSKHHDGRCLPNFQRTETGTVVVFTKNCPTVMIIWIFFFTLVETSVLSRRNSVMQKILGWADFPLFYYT